MELRRWTGRTPTTRRSSCTRCTKRGRPGRAVRASLGIMPLCSDELNPPPVSPVPLPRAEWDEWYTERLLSLEEIAARSPRPPGRESSSDARPRRRRRSRKSARPGSCACLWIRTDDGSSGQVLVGRVTRGQPSAGKLAPVGSPPTTGAWARDPTASRTPARKSPAEAGTRHGPMGNGRRRTRPMRTGRPAPASWSPPRSRRRRRPPLAPP